MLFGITLFHLISFLKKIHLFTRIFSTWILAFLVVKFESFHLVSWIMYLYLGTEWEHQWVKLMNVRFVHKLERIKAEIKMSYSWGINENSSRLTENIKLPQFAKLPLVSAYGRQPFGLLCTPLWLVPQLLVTDWLVDAVKVLLHVTLNQSLSHHSSVPSECHMNQIS